MHIVDEGNPLRFEELRILGFNDPIFSNLDPYIKSISRYQDPYSALIWNLTINSINERHKIKPMDFLISTGDHTDTDLENELRWFIELADGYISKDYFDRTGKKAVAPIKPIGLANTLPWYAALGNHDVMYEGSINNDLLFGKLLGLVTKEGININKDRRKLINKIRISAPYELSSMKESIDLYSSSVSQPYWHGFTNMPEPFEGYYSFTPKPYIHCIVLNTANYYPQHKLPKETFASGVLDKIQLKWLINEIENNYDKLCIIFSHHPSKSWSNIVSEIKKDEFENLISLYENVIVHISGHTHENSITSIKKNDGGYWAITTSSIIDYPQEWRAFSIYDNGNGTGSIITQMLRHNNQDLYNLAMKDAGEKVSKNKGLDTDRNVELLFPMPTIVKKNIDKNLT